MKSKCQNLQNFDNLRNEYRATTEHFHFLKFLPPSFLVLPGGTTVATTGGTTAVTETTAVIETTAVMTVTIGGTIAVMTGETTVAMTAVTTEGIIVIMTGGTTGTGRVS